VISIRDKQLMASFGLRIRQLRMEKGLSQQNLADRAEIEISQVYRIEKGKTNTTLSTIGALASALDISIAEIFSNLETAKL